MLLELVLVTLAVNVVLGKSVGVRWCGQLSWVMLALVVEDELVRVALLVSALLSWMLLLVGAFAATWLLDGAWSSVFVRRWRIYCMMLVDVFRGFVGLGCWCVCVAVEWWWRS